MKRIIFAAVILVFGFGFTACNDESEEIVPQSEDVLYNTEGGGGEDIEPRD